MGVDHEYHEPTVDEYLRGLINAIVEAEQPLLHMQSVLIHVLKNKIPENKNMILNGQHQAQLGGNRGVQSYKFSKSPLFKLLDYTRILNPIYFRLKKPYFFYHYRFLKTPLTSPYNPMHRRGNTADINFVCDYFKVERFDVFKDLYNLLKPYSELTPHDLNSTRSLYTYNALTLSTWSKICESNQKAFYVPFNDLGEYTYKIPKEITYSSTKFLQKEVMRYYEVPEYIMNRKKRGFNPVKTEPLLRGGIFDPLIPVASKAFDEEIIRRMQPKTWSWDKFWSFWHLINYSIWKRIFIDNEPKESLLEEL
jgi:hypothetical protein